jgi:hypothetical protein
VHRSGGLDRSIEASLVVPAVLRNPVPMQGLNLDNYLIYLSPKDKIDINTYDKEPNEEGNYVEPDCLLLHEPPSFVLLLSTRRLADVASEFQTTDPNPAVAGLGLPEIMLTPKSHCQKVGLGCCS